MLKFALRNILRNRKRSLLSMLAIFIASLVVLFTEGWLGGVLSAYTAGTARLQTGHIRILSENYLKRERFLPVDETVPGADALMKKIKAIEGVKSVEERLRFGILLGKGSRTFPAVGMGIEFGKSRLRIRERLAEQYPRDRFDPDAIYPGRKLAAKLKASPGDALLLATRTSWGGLNGIKLKLGRPIGTGSGKLDKGSFFISAKQARRLLRIGRATIEIYVYLDNPYEAASMIKKISRFLPPGVKAYTLAQQSPALYDYLVSVKSFMVLIDAFILFLASFVVINTMMMAVFERTREFGTLKALGMGEKRIIAGLGIEGALMGGAGAGLGTALGWVIITIVGKIGLDLSSQMEGIDIPLEYVIRPTVDPGTVLLTVLLAVIISMAAAVIPASRIRKMSAAEALREG